MLRHPWSPSLIGRPMLGPNVLMRTEYLQSALVRSGFTALQLAVATRLLANYVIGAALTEATWRLAVAPAAQTEARRHITANPGAYPTLNASGHLDTTRWSDDDLFEHGLDAIFAIEPQTLQIKHEGDLEDAQPGPRSAGCATCVPTRSCTS
jgi:Tetracyclin repressor-like, C-terminal domain